MRDHIREVVVDTETTGLNIKSGDKVVEIGCIELINHIPSGKFFQTYVNPESKEVSSEAYRTHKLDNNFLKEQPLFKEIADDFIKFLSNDNLIIHNAKFDLGFINNELKLSGMPSLKNKVIDTLALAKQKIGTGAANLDALCKRFNISIAERKIHGAILDSTLLAEVYIELLGGRQRGFNFSKSSFNKQKKETEKRKNERTPAIIIDEEEQKEHKKFIKTIKNALWNKHAY